MKKMDDCGLKTLQQLWAIEQEIAIAYQDIAFLKETARSCTNEAFNYKNGAYIIENPNGKEQAIAIIEDDQVRFFPLTSTGNHE